MANIVISGDTSGSVTLSAPAVSGTTTLTLPTTSGTVLTTASTTGVNASAITTGMLDQAYGGTGTTIGYNGFKNRIINGAMVIDQRNAGASVTITNTGANTYTLDRWFAYGSAASKFSVQQDAGAVTPPTGFTDYLGVTSLAATSVGSSDQYVIGHFIEGFNSADLAWGTANAATVTMSFWVRSSLTGTFGGVLRNSGFNRSYPFSYTINAANTWEQKSITIVGDTAGTWLTTNGVGIGIYFGLGVGSSLSGTAGSWSGSNFTSVTGATSVVGTNGATFYITGVQLEKGSTATSFDYRPYGTELALCQRYYYSMVAGNSLPVVTASNYSSSDSRGVVSFPVTMRATPTLASSSGSGYFAIFTNSTSASFNSFLSDVLSTNNAELKNGTSISVTAGQSGFMRTSNAAASLAFSAEL